MTASLDDERSAFRFWSRVSPSVGTECWEWTGHIDRKGYGQFCRWNGRKFGAHRVSYATCVADIPSGMLVLHSCDNRKCVNPAHLSVGTPLDNMRDKVVRGRLPDCKGERNGRAKLVVAEVVEIRRLLGSGQSIKSLAATYGVHVSTVRSIQRGERWAGVSQ